MFIFLSPLILFGDLAVLYGFVKLWAFLADNYNFFKNAHAKIPKLITSRDPRGVFRGGAFDLLMVCFMPLLQPALSIFDCISLGGDFTVMRQSPTIECFTSPHNAGVGVSAIILAALLVCFPATAFYFSITRHHKGKLNAEDHNDPYGVLYQQFSDKFYWYLGVDILERTALVAFSVIFAYNELYYSFAMFVGIWLLLYPRIFFAIYRETLDNQEKIFSLMCLMGLALNRTYQYYNGAEDAFLANFFLFVPLVLVPVKAYQKLLALKAVYAGLKNVYQERKMSRRNIFLDTVPGTLPLNAVNFDGFVTNGGEVVDRVPRQDLEV